MTNVASTSRLSLEDWDALAPLNEIESESVSRIQVFGSIKPIPSHVSPIVEHRTQNTDCR
jgi:hypothetical protein